MSWPKVKFEVDTSLCDDNDLNVYSLIQQAYLLAINDS